MNTKVKIGSLRENRTKGRTAIDPQAFKGLFHQVLTQDLDAYQPIVVSRLDGGLYEIQSGHRRWLAYVLTLSFHEEEHPGLEEIEYKHVAEYVDRAAGAFEGGLT